MKQEETPFLIVNADDYGRTPDISRGIRQAHLTGVVTSTTCMMNYPNTAEDIHLAQRETPGLGLGVHLVLTSGKPLQPPTNVPGLVNTAGSFHTLQDFLIMLPGLDLAQVQAEWQAQIESFVQSAGRPPTHLDAHHHTAFFTPGLFGVMLSLARTWGTAIRLPTPDPVSGSLGGLPAEIAAQFTEFGPPLLAEFKPPTPTRFISSFFDQTATLERALQIVDTLEPGVTEWMCHPGFSDTFLAAGSSYNVQRDRELAVLTNPTLASAIHQRNITLRSFHKLGK